MTAPAQPPERVVVFRLDDRELTALESIAHSLSILAVEAQKAPRTAPPASAAPADGLTFRMGKTKGEPLAKAAINDVRSYAHFIARTLDNNPRYAEANRRHFAEVNAHLVARGSTAIPEPEKAPPPPGRARVDEAPPEDPPPSDVGPAQEDIPF